MVLNVKSLGLAAGIAAGITSIVCLAAFVLFPQQAAYIGSALFHGVSVEAKPVDVVSAITGFVTAVVGAAVVLAIFGLVYNALSKE